LSDVSSRTSGQNSQPGRQIVDDTDRAILRALRDDGRMPVMEIARRANISRAGAYARLERLRTSGVIEGFGVRIRPRAIGLEVAALIFLSVEQDRWREIRDELTTAPEVEFVALAASDFDFVLLVRVEHTDELRDVVLERLAGMDGVKSTRTVFLLDEFSLGPIIP
jgi:DNA-binding Lrp family transcriptional regulator